MIEPAPLLRRTTISPPVSIDVVSSTMHSLNSTDHEDSGDVYIHTLPNTLESQKILNRQILDELNQYLEENGYERIESQLPEDFTPDKVADRILSFVSIGIAGIDSDAPRYTERLQAARDGMERGFSEAVEILEGLGVYDGEIKANAEYTLELLRQGFDELIVSAT